MKVTTPQIVWHSKEPVFSADFHHSGGELWRLATGGADKDVKIWKLLREEGTKKKEEEVEERKVKMVFMASLSRHTGSVNVVRFSPNGEFLASAGDDNVVCLWKLGEGGGAIGNIAMDTNQPNKETWNVTKMLRGHLEDIYDASWSSDSLLLATGSVDNTAIVWDINKGTPLHVLTDSKQYVQGVAWDPNGNFLATLSNDRCMRVYAATDPKFKCIHSVSKMTASDQEKGGVGGGGGIGKQHQFRMWMDESLSSFFRRLAFSPDGNLLVVPAGRYENGDNKAASMTYIFTRSNFSKPVACLPCPEKPTVIVRFCPKLFQLRSSSIEKEKSLFSLPYRMVYAVASLDSVLFYDTQQTTPFAYISDIHYSGITDLAWSDDGLVLIVTSSDAYCSIVTFEPGELGVAVETGDLPEHMKAISKQQQQRRKLLEAGQNQKGRVSGCVGDERRSTTPHRKQKSMKVTVEEEGGGGGGGGGGNSASEDRVMAKSPLIGTSPGSGAVSCGVGAGEEEERGGGGGEGERKEAKSKRRITTTLVETFTSPPSSSSSSSSPSSSISPSSSTTEPAQSTTSGIPSEKQSNHHHQQHHQHQQQQESQANDITTDNSSRNTNSLFTDVTQVTAELPTAKGNNDDQVAVVTTAANGKTSGEGKKQPRRVSFVTLGAGPPPPPLPLSCGPVGQPSSPNQVQVTSSSSASAQPKVTLLSFLQSTSPPPPPPPPSQPLQSGSCDPNPKSRDQSSTHSLTEPTNNDGTEPMDVQIVE